MIELDEHYGQRRYGKHSWPALPVFQVVNTMQYVWGMIALIW